jgi:23S rRNA pseudouridine1911/1915/1917 synthase
MEKFEFQVLEKEHKTRLEDFLLAKFPEISKIYLREIVRDEKCEVNGRWENRGFILRVNDFVEIELDFMRNVSLQPEPIPLEIIYEENEFLIVNKPAGMLIHPTVRVRTGTLLNALAYYLNEKTNGGEHVRAGLVHRLDKETSGLVCIAKTPRAHRILCDHFQRKLVEKRYFALVDGVIKKDTGTIEAPIGRFEAIRLWNIKEDGKHALTNFRVEKRFAKKTLLELEPVTGRTNQLRIHLAHIGHPITGDEKYGGEKYGRMCLHAYKLSFWHPDGGQRMEFETALPEEFDLSEARA